VSITSLAAHFLATLVLSATAAFADYITTPVDSAWSARVETRGDLIIHIGPIRTVMREARTPTVCVFRDKTIVLCAGSHLGTQTIRSENGGRSWKRQQTDIAELDTLELHDGRMIELQSEPKLVPGGLDEYEFARFLSTDEGLTLTPLPKGRLHLPADKFDPKLPHYFDGNIVEMSDGRLLATMQGQQEPGDTNHAWATFLVESKDRGATWDFTTLVASKNTIDDPDGLLARNDWKLYYAVEPYLIDLGHDRMVCAMRASNDEFPNMSLSLVSPASDTYEDLSFTVPGDGIYPGLMKLPADHYYKPGPPNVPLVIAYSSDGGRSWSRGKPMAQARGVFPRMAYSDGLLALTYGGLSGVPRWGNCITFSTDGGKNWTDEIEIGPFLTTGYTALVSTGPGKFVAFFDCTAPQPWKDDAAFWIGAVDVTVEKAR
jgi:hypothetical protein